LYRQRDLWVKRSVNSFLFFSGMSYIHLPVAISGPAAASGNGFRDTSFGTERCLPPSGDGSLWGLFPM
jgi:hypothetical protein